MPFFKSQINCFTAVDDYPCTILSQNACYGRGSWFNSVLRHLFYLISILLTGINGEGNGTPLHYSCLENPMDGGAWWATVHGVAKSRTWLSDFTFTFHFHALKKEMATHSGVLAWRIPGTGEPGGLPSMGSHEVGHDWSYSAAAAAATGIKCLAKNKQGGTLSADVYVRSFLYLFLYFHKTMLNVRYKWSSLVPGPGSNSSPLEAMNPGIVHSSQPQSFYSIYTITYILYICMGVCV